MQGVGFKVSVSYSGFALGPHASRNGAVLGTKNHIFAPRPRGLAKRTKHARGLAKKTPERKALSLSKKIRIKNKKGA